MRLSKGLFKKFNITTIIAVYILILVGGIVRSVGAGMGCPDWPKCFGQYVPPTSEEELPANYKQVYLEKRLAKNERFAATLSSMGFNQLSDRIRNDPNVKVEEDFSPVLAWVEYINRLIGALIGLFILLNVVFSFSYWRENRSLSYMAIGSLILVLFQGWIGSLVVSTNLLPGFISFHMALALLLVAMLIWIQYRLSSGKDREALHYRGWIVLSFILFIPQIFLGTQVRESIDQLVVQGFARNEWMANIDWVFYIHRSFSLVFGAITAYLLFDAYKRGVLLTTLFGKLLTFAGVLVLIEIVGGAVMAYFDVPAFIQPIHLFIGSILFGVYYYLVLLVNRKSSAI
jgi:cytochrome c oxidase assembly protein subunit 15